MYMYTTATTTTTAGSRTATENQALLTAKQDYVNYQLDFPDVGDFSLTSLILRQLSVKTRQIISLEKMLTDEAETFRVTGKRRRQ